MNEFLRQFKKVKKSGSGWLALCNSHEDLDRSLLISHENGKWLLHCHAGCKTETIVAAAGLEMKDLFDANSGTSAKGNASAKTKTKANKTETKALPGPGFTLAQ